MFLKEQGAITADEKLTLTMYRDNAVQAVHLCVLLLSYLLPRFPFIEPPSMSSIENSVVFLKEQGAITGDEKLTPIGTMLSRLPVDVVIGKMLIMGTIFQVRSYRYLIKSSRWNSFILFERYPKFQI